ncbi:MAG: methyltransferase domain-containing protein, partial [Nanoarchaeota archaeon]|nr:methyltransferase domain-containing protein [Nanoarchaeota archaeon]
GAGSGYNAALLGRIIGDKGKVYSVEIVPELVEVAKRNLNEIDVKNVEAIFGDGSKGYEKEAPYDRIVVSCACPEEVLGVLVGQLKIGGVLVAPLGGYPQVMTRVRKLKGGNVEREEFGDFVFVPLRGGR